MAEGAACVVSCAARSVHGSGTAARTSSAARLERQIVVLLIQRLRERFERLRCLPFGRCTRGDLGSFAATALGRQHDQFARNDLGDVARLLLAIFPGAVLDPPLDVDLIALLEVLLGDVREAGSLATVIPADDPVPLGFLL